MRYVCFCKNSRLFDDLQVNRYHYWTDVDLKQWDECKVNGVSAATTIK